MKAKKICAQLITRALKSLDEDQEEAVVDYLESIGVSVDLDANPRDLCVLLLEKTIDEEIRKSPGSPKPPLTAYANKLLGKETEIKKEKEEVTKAENIKRNRKNTELNLQAKSKSLPGCVPSDLQVFQKRLYEFLIDPEVGISSLPDGSSQYTATVAIPENMYSKIYEVENNPVVEISNSKGGKAYGRLTLSVDEQIRVSPLIGLILSSPGAKDGGFMKLCSTLPYIANVKFVYYGGQKDLDEVLPVLNEKLPLVIEAFSYLSIGMVVTTSIGGKDVFLRVDELTDEDNTPIFAGLLPPGLSEIPYEISPDL